jgi:hypothetical protein
MNFLRDLVDVVGLHSHTAEVIVFDPKLWIYY